VRSGGGLSECFSCRQATEPDRVPRKHILVTDSWTVAHAFDTGLPGWLVLLPIRHVTALHELTSDEAAGLGPLLRDLSIALQEVVGCEKTYVMLFAEAEGFAHLHFHVVPRMPDQPEELRGPGIFGMLGLPAESRVPDAEMDRVAVAIRQALGKT
jgi:diadenosine tetraphosphate (Ap4A) HIT family hydrolase